MFKSKENRSYVSTDEMLKDLGYKTVTPTIGSLGQALMQASRENPDCKWLREHEDNFFRELRRERKQRNGRKK